MNLEQNIQQNTTIFGKILRGEIPCNKIYEDEHILAFHDIAPNAKVHALVIPKKRIESLHVAKAEDKEVLAHLLLKIPEIAHMLGLDEGYRMLTNVGENGGQTVFHIHFHVLGGEKLGPNFAGN